MFIFQSKYSSDRISLKRTSKDGKKGYRLISRSMRIGWILVRKMNIDCAAAKWWPFAIDRRSKLHVQLMSNCFRIKSPSAANWITSQSMRPDWKLRGICAPFNGRPNLTFGGRPFKRRTTSHLHTRHLHTRQMGLSVTWIVFHLLFPFHSFFNFSPKFSE